MKQKILSRLSVLIVGCMVLFCTIFFGGCFSLKEEKSPIIFSKIPQMFGGNSISENGKYEGEIVAKYEISLDTLYSVEEDTLYLVGEDTLYVCSLLYGGNIVVKAAYFPNNEPYFYSEGLMGLDSSIQWHEYWYNDILTYEDSSYIHNKILDFNELSKKSQIKYIYQASISKDGNLEIYIDRELEDTVFLFYASIDIETGELLRYQDNAWTSFDAGEFDKETSYRIYAILDPIIMDIEN